MGATVTENFDHFNAGYAFTTFTGNHGNSFRVSSNRFLRTMRGYISFDSGVTYRMALWRKSDGQLLTVSDVYNADQNNWRDHPMLSVLELQAGVEYVAGAYHVTSNTQQANFLAGYAAGSRAGSPHTHGIVTWTGWGQSQPAPNVSTMPAQGAGSEAEALIGLELVENRPPNTPTNVLPNGATGANSVTLSAVVSDPDGDNIYAQFQIANDTSFSSGIVDYTGSTVGNGGTSTFALNNLTPNRSYALRARAIDASGFGSNASGYSAAVTFTTNRPPSTPGAPAVTPNPVNTTGTVSYAASTDPDGQAVTYTTELSTDNGASYSAIKTATTATSFVHDFTNVPATTAARLRTRATDPLGSNSAWATSGSFTVEHNVAPTTPTRVAPANGSFLDRTAVQRFSWTHNDTAGDAQSKHDFRYRLVGGATWTTLTTTGTATLRDVPANTFAVGSYEWQVQTYDSLGLASGFSTSGFFDAVTPPVGPTLITPPNNSTQGLAVGIVEWSYPTQQAYEVRKLADLAGAADTGNVLFTTGVVESVTGRTLAVDYPVNNRVEHVQVRIRENGLWSPWSSSKVTVSYSAPHVPSVTVTTLDTTNRLGGSDAVSVGVVPKIGNMLTVNQASLETDITGVTATANCTVARSTAQAFDGTASLAVTAQAAGDVQASFTTANTTGPPVVPGQVYTAVAHLRAATTARAVRVRIRWNDSAGNSLGLVDGADNADHSAGWVQARGTFQAPAGAATANVRAVIIGCAASEVHYVDAVGLFTDPTGNLVTNPDFENGTTGWTPGGTATLTADPAQAYTGRQSMRVAATGQFGNASLNFPTTVGGQYTASAYVLAPTSPQPMQLKIVDSGGNLVGSAFSNITPGSTWQRVVVTFTATTSSSTLQWLNLNATGGATSFIDAVQVVVGSSPVEYLPPTTHNLVVNPSFEASPGTTGWVPQTGSSIATSTALTRFGGASLLLSYGNVVADSGFVASPEIPVVAGQRYTSSAYVYVPAGSPAVVLKLSTPGVAVLAVSSPSTVTGAWERLTVTAPATTGIVGTSVHNATAASVGQGVYIDAVQVEQGSVATPYVDGSLGAGYRWDASENLVTNPSFEVDTAGWQGLNRNLLTANQSSLETDTTGWPNTSNVTVSRSTAQALDGSASLAMTATAAGSMQTNAVAVSVVPGQVYTAVAHFRAATTGRAVTVSINWRTSAGVDVQPYLVGQVGADNSAGWRQLAFTAQAPATAAQAQVTIVVQGAAAGEVHYVDAVGLFETPNANLIANPDFENGTTGATASANVASLTASTEQAYTGRQSLRVLPTGSGDAKVDIAMPAVTGPRTASFYLYVTQANSIIDITYAGTSKRVTTGPANTWQRFSTTTDNATQTSLGIINNTTPGQPVFYIDAVQVVVGSSPVEYLPPTTHNLLTNPSFETGATSWGIVNSTLATGPSGAFVGATALAATALAAGTFGSFHATIPAEQGINYTFSVWVSGTPGVQTSLVRMEWKGPAGGLGQSAPAPVVSLTGTPQRVVISGVAPAGTTGIVPTVYATATAAGNVCQIDAVQVEQGSVANPYVDGSLGAGYRWDASESPIQNPAGAVDTSGWQSNTSNTPFTISRVTGVSGPPVSTAIRAAVGANANSYQFVQGVGATYPTGHSFFVAGQTYTVSFWARSISGGTSFSVDFKNGPSLNNPGLGASFLLTTSWQRFVFTGVAVANGAADSHFTFNTNGGTDYTFEFTAVQVEQRPYATAYAAPGTAHASTSSRQTPWVLGGTSIETIYREAGGSFAGAGRLVLDNNLKYVWYPFGNYPLGVETIVSVAPNTTYTCSLYTIYGGNAKAVVRDSASNAVLAEKAVTRFEPSWGRTTLTFTTGSLTTSVRLQVTHYTNYLETIYLDAVQLEQRPYATAFGATGTPNASTSTRRYAWELSRPAVVSVDVHRREGDTGDGIRIAKDLPPTTTYTDRSVANRTRYQYRVRALTAAGAAADTAWIE